ncbi:MAG: ABC transporter permease [Acidobacteria bacterium]|nr:ABC transporter permease [Acidobacteriota bacterium]
MINYRIVAVVKRELKEKLFSKSFLLTTFLIPLFMLGIIVVQGVIMQFQGDKNTVLEIIVESPSLLKELQTAFSQNKSIEEAKYSLSYRHMSRAQVDGYIEEKNKSLSAGKIDGIVFIPESAINDKSIEYYSKTPKAFAVTSKVSGLVNACLMDVYFRERNIADEDLNYARMNVDVKTFKVTEEKAVEETGMGNTILAYIFAFFLYLSLIMIGTMTMQTVMDEKTGRISEILLSSVHSRELLAGKILGVSITGVIQMAIWLSPILMLASTTWFALPPQISIDVSPGLLLYFLLNYFIGLLTFVGLYAAVGSIFDNQQDAQSGVWPLLLLIMIPFFMTFSMFNNPDNPVVNVASLLPFASIMIMPVKMTVADVAVWKIILSFCINVATVCIIFKLAGKIYRVGILRTGTKPKWSQIVKWIRYNY